MTDERPLWERRKYESRQAYEVFEVLDATALGSRLGFKRDTVLAYLSRRNFGRIPRPNRQLAMGPLWYEKRVKEWEAKEED
jgi:hypothetical protein